MAEIVGLVASILQLVDIVANARHYVQGSRNARKDQEKLLLEIQNLQPLIAELNQRRTGNQVVGATSTIQRFEQPLKTLEETMKQLTQKLQPNGPIRKLFTRLTWPLWGKDDVRDVLNTIERSQGWLNPHTIRLPIADHYQGLHSSSGRHRTSSAVKDVGEKVDHNVFKFANASKKLTISSKPRVKMVRGTKLLGIRGPNYLPNTETLCSPVQEVGRDQRQYHQAVECDTKIAWYSPLNFFLRQADVFSGHQSGTGAWFLQHKVFQEWKSMSEKYYAGEYLAKESPNIDHRLSLFLTANLRTAPEIVEGALGVEFLHRSNVVAWRLEVGGSPNYTTSIFPSSTTELSFHTLLGPALGLFTPFFIQFSGP
ncbi:hypothetical protein B0H14DRAFT_3743119 [Mycena olivaceomarginata]|nr:hypothetical protein B0H14DRAFT_3743119 [Mycena olivaceomarginata]